MFWIHQETLEDVIANIEQNRPNLQAELRGKFYTIALADGEAQNGMSAFDHFIFSTITSQPTAQMFQVNIPIIVERYVQGGPRSSLIDRLGVPNYTVKERRRLKRAAPFVRYPFQFRMDAIQGCGDDATTLKPTMYRWMQSNMVGDWSWDGLFTFAFDLEEDYVLFKLRWK